ncbi:hypothetical protein BDW69DRAFT_188880 [Aspergillus filifer]
MKPYSTRPIAINLDLWTITAAYAHTLENNTILAKVPTSAASLEHSLTLSKYRYTAHTLRKYHGEDYFVRTIEKSKWRKGLEAKWKKGKYYFDGTVGIWLWVLKRRIELSTSVWVAPVRDLIRGGTTGAEYLKPAVLSAAKWTGIYNPRRDISLEEIKDAFTEAFSTVRDVTLENTGVNITSAIILYPDFYNTAIQEAISDAAYETNISGWMPSMKMTHRQLFERYSNLLLFNRSRSSGVSGEPNLLLLNQGFRTFDLLTSGEHCLMNVPVDELSCFGLMGSLFWKLAREDRYPVLREELRRGADTTRLWREIGNARWYLKAQRKTDMEGEGEGVTEKSEMVQEDAELVHEWPLNLDGWWVSDAEQAISLRWEDIEAVDQQYVDYLADCLDGVQMCLQGATRSPAPHSTKSTVDGVVMLDNYCDGSLLTRAAQKSIGHDVRVFGGLEGADSTYLARLGSQVALRMYERGLKERQDSCRNKKDEEVADEPLFGAEWDEEVRNEHDEL